MTKPWLVTCLAVISILMAFTSGVLADQPESEAARQSPLPKIKIDRGLAYPDAAKRLGAEGKVILGFDIAADGRATNISLVSSDDPIFEKPAMDLLKVATFELSKAENGELIHETRYRLGLVFCLPPSSLDDTFPMRVIPIVVSSTRIRGSPIRNPPARGAVGQCARVQ